VYAAVLSWSAIAITETPFSLALSTISNGESAPSEQVV
jgi:hypothetical protein